MTINYYFDESGQDGKNSPLVVVGGFSIDAKDILAFETEIKRVYFHCFGVEYDYSHELKGNSLLSKRRFKEANYYFKMQHTERKNHCAFIRSGQSKDRASFKDISAYAQACLLFVKLIIQTLDNYNINIWSAYVTNIGFKNIQNHILTERNNPSNTKHLVNEAIQIIDTHLFQKICHFNWGNSPSFIFDKSQDHSDLNRMKNIKAQIQKYKNDYNRALEIGEILFVDSEQSLFMQIADIVSFLINFGYGIYESDNEIEF